MFPANLYYQTVYNLCRIIRSRVLICAFSVMAPLFITEKFYAIEEEVLLSFEYPAVGQVYINILYDTRLEKGFLPLTELFSLLGIHYTADASSFEIRGNYPSSDNNYSVNLKDRFIHAGNKVYHLSPDEYRIGMVDIFLAPSLFGEIFGLQFAVDMMNLEIRLSATGQLPVEERQAREKVRQLAGTRADTKKEETLQYPLERSWLDGAMVDYSLTARYGNGNGNMNYYLTGGAEVLGGDFQGTLAGFHTQTGIHSLKTAQLRWKYTLPQNKYLTGVTLGKISSGGFEPLTLKGFALTNNPVEPRISFGKYLFQGEAPPGSEVELYTNDRLSGFLTTDATGEYYFEVPLNYGTTRTRTLIYAPSGEIVTEKQLIQVPYSFLPPGEFSYHIEAGQLFTQNKESLSSPLGGHAKASLGINNWLTAHSGIQFNQKQGVFRHFVPYYGFSARIASQYTVNLNTSPGVYFDLSGQVLYSNHVNFTFRYSGFYERELFHFFHPDKEATAHFTFPLKIKKYSILFRMGGDTRQTFGNSHTRLTADMSVRLAKVNLRLNYRNILASSGKLNNWNEKIILPSFTYTLPYSNDLPAAIRGLFIRGQVKFDPVNRIVKGNEIYFSKNFRRNGRINLTVSHEYGQRLTYAQAGLILDFETVRNHLALQATDKGMETSHTLSGSAGWDRQNRTVVWDNRQQAGQAAASVMLFADCNNSGKYDEGDKLLPGNAVTVDRPVSMKLGKDSLLRLHQLQSYHLYCLTVNRDLLPDPSLVPAKSHVSFIAEPNQFKKILIPFYPGGILEGRVMIQRDEIRSGMGGIRLILRSEAMGFEKTIRSFADGEFYCMDLVPGSYTLEVDPVQLNLLNMRQADQKEIHIKSVSRQSYAESFEINLISNRPKEMKNLNSRE
jgi:hypothetical protein